MLHAAYINKAEGRRRRKREGGKERFLLIGALFIIAMVQNHSRHLSVDKMTFKMWCVCVQ